MTAADATHSRSTARPRDGRRRRLWLVILVWAVVSTLAAACLLAVQSAIELSP